MKTEQNEKGGDAYGNLMSTLCIQVSWKAYLNGARILGLNSLSGKMSYRQISWRPEAARLDVLMIVSLWHLASSSEALLSRHLSNFRTIGKV